MAECQVVVLYNNLSLKYVKMVFNFLGKKQLHTCFTSNFKEKKKKKTL